MGSPVSAVSPNINNPILPASVTLFFRTGESQGLCVTAGLVYGWDKIVPKVVPGKSVRTVHWF
jgi:hypothetical protein